MRGKRRTNEERHELFEALESYLAMGFSLKKACSLSEIPYSSMRDMLTIMEPLRAKTAALQNTVNVTARTNIINAIQQGDISISKWWLEHFDHPEPQVSPQYGGMEEARLTIAEFKDELEEETREQGAERLRLFWMEYFSQKS